MRRETTAPFCVARPLFVWAEDKHSLAPSVASFRGREDPGAGTRSVSCTVNKQERAGLRDLASLVLLGFEGYPAVSVALQRWFAWVYDRRSRQLGNLSRPEI